MYVFLPHGSAIRWGGGAPAAIDYPVGFLAASFLLIYRIMHQTILWGDIVRQAAAPSS